MKKKANSYEIQATTLQFMREGFDDYQSWLKIAAGASKS